MMNLIKLFSSVCCSLAAILYIGKFLSGNEDIDLVIGLLFMILGKIQSEAKYEAR